MLTKENIYRLEQKREELLFKLEVARDAVELLKLCDKLDEIEDQIADLKYTEKD